MTTATSTPRKLSLFLLPAVFLIVLLASTLDRGIAQRLYLGTTYYLLMVALLCWLGTYLYVARDLRREAALAWAKENWPGIVIALSVSVIAALAIEPALRMLSDEANLVGTSKNLFASKSPTFTVSGKYYYGRYWDVDVAIDQRPPLFPFLVSLVHATTGYSYANAFAFNLMLLPAFLMLAYRLAKSVGGETAGIVAAFVAAAHPALLISVRSGGFDFLATTLSLLVLKSVFDFVHGKRPEHLAILWMNLCLFAEARYESALFLPCVVALLLLYRLISWHTLRPFALVYSLTPAFLLPRVWLSILRGSVPKQAPGTVTFSAEHFLNNAYEYFQPVLQPSGSHSAHSAVLIAIGTIGCVAGLRWIYRQFRFGDGRAADSQFALFVAGWMSLQAVIVFSYAWGRAQFPSSARLVIPIDVFFSLAAAWLLAHALRRVSAFVPVLLSSALFVLQLPVASQDRMMNRLTQTRESAATWRFFERRGDLRILIVTDRPNHFTIMNYGAMSFEGARSDRHLFTALDRHMFQDVYVIQHIELSTGRPLPGYELWSDRRLDPVFEFQNDANVLVRISRFAHSMSEHNL